MKNFFAGFIVCLSLIVLTGFVHKVSFKDNPKKEWIVAPRFLTLQQGITKQQAKDWMESTYLPLYRHYSGWNAQLGEPTASGKWGVGDNSAKDKGDFVLLYLFDSPQTRDHYFPPTGDWSDDIKKVLADHPGIWENFFGKYFVQDKYRNEEYTMFASAK